MERGGDVSLHALLKELLVVGRVLALVDRRRAGVLHAEVRYLVVADAVVWDRLLIDRWSFVP